MCLDSKKIIVMILSRPFLVPFLVPAFLLSQVPPPPPPPPIIPSQLPPAMLIMLTSFPNVIIGK